MQDWLISSTLLRSKSIHQHMLQA